LKIFISSVDFARPITVVIDLRLLPHPILWSKDDTEDGVPTRTTASMSPISIPTSNVIVQTQKQNSRSLKALSVASRQEAPGAYKDVDRVAEVSDKIGIATKVVRLIPLAVVKG
jgi:hypothetical protein